VIALMEATRTSETSVDIQLRTWQYISEDSELHYEFCHYDGRMYPQYQVTMMADWDIHYRQWKFFLLY
jgi:hypothetical protein